MAPNPGKERRAGARDANAPHAKRQSTAAARVEQAHLGGLGGTSLVLGVRWSFRGKDAGSVNSRKLLARLRYQGGAGGEQRGPTAQATFRQGLVHAVHQSGEAI